MASLVGAILFLLPITLPIFHSPFPTSISHFPGCYPMLPHCLPCRVSRGASTLPHRLPLRSIPPPRFACGSSHSRGHGRPRSVRKSSRLRWKCLSMDCICSDKANLSAHLHRLPTPPPHLRRMRLLPGRGQVSDGKLYIQPKSCRSAGDPARKSMLQHRVVAWEEGNGRGK